MRTAMRSLRQRTVTRATFLIEPVERRFLLASFVVTTTADSGPGSLREAITLSNTTPGFDDILFAIPGTGVQTIGLEAPLPAITDSVTIDATTQPGWSGSPVVVIDGSNAGPHADGLVIASSDPIAASNVLALGVQNFHGNGVVITGNGNLVALMEISGNKGNGVLIEGNNNFLAENTIASNKRNGILIAAGTGNDIALNRIFSNKRLGIDLGGDGVTPNDPLDADTGPNTLQNFPVLNTPTVAPGGGLVVTGSINTTPNTLLAITFYTSPTAEGQGQVVQDTIQVVTDASGNATFGTTLFGAAPTDYVTATATSITFSGDAAAVNGSEFSAPVSATGTAAPAAAAGRSEEDEGVLTAVLA